jgi:hypothetical protein
MYMEQSGPCKCLKEDGWEVTRANHHTISFPPLDIRPICIHGDGVIAGGEMHLTKRIACTLMNDNFGKSSTQSSLRCVGYEMNRVGTRFEAL